MNCPKCERELREYATYCPSCMMIFQDHAPTEVEEISSRALYPRPTKRIAFVWGLLGVNILYFLVFDYLLTLNPGITDQQFGIGFIIQTMIFIFTMVCSILLIRNKNKTAKVNGIILLSIMIMILVVVIVAGIFVYSMALNYIVYL